MKIFTLNYFQKSSYVIALALLIFVVMCHDFSNWIFNSGLKILVLQYYLEPKMVSKIIIIIYMFSNHQAGVRITILLVNILLLPVCPSSSLPIFFISPLAACLVCLDNRSKRKESVPC